MRSPLTRKVQSENNKSNSKVYPCKATETTNNSSQATTRRAIPTTTRTNCISGQKLLGEMVRLLGMYYGVAVQYSHAYVGMRFVCRPAAPAACCRRLSVSPHKTHTRAEAAG